MKIIVFMLLMASACYAGQTYQNALRDANGNASYYTRNDDNSTTTTYQQGGLNDANGNPTYYSQNSNSALERSDHDDGSEN